MGKWIKQIIVMGMAAAILVWCCSCSLVRDFDVLMKGMQSAASTRAPQLSELPELPAPAQQDDGEALPENTPVPSLDRDTTVFDTLVDTEGLLSGKNTVTLSEIVSGALYMEQEDGTYLKETPFMGKDGGIILGFGQDGKNNYIDYFYSGELQSVTAEKVIREMEILTGAVEQKYGEANLHLWAMSPTGFDADMSLVGEFTEEEISDAVTRNMYAGFQYTWRRVGGSLAYVTLFLDGQGNYSVDFIYDNTQAGAYGSFEA